MSGLQLITPTWPAPACVGAAMSTRMGGVSRPPFDSLNLRPGGLDERAGPDDSGSLDGKYPPATAGDQPGHTAANIERYASAIGVRPFFLRQVHGARVLHLDDQDPADIAIVGAGPYPIGDASVTTRSDVACTVLVADCLPVLFTDTQGRAVAAAHAGWRGLAAGVLEATVQALCRAANCTACEVLAWLGPCIGPAAFEVGADVLQAFDATAAQPGQRFNHTPRPDGSQRWHADLAGLAQDRLQRMGVGSITASALCTVSDASRFFSFRRDGLTGRLAASIWRRA